MTFRSQPYDDGAHGMSNRPRKPCGYILLAHWACLSFLVVFGLAAFHRHALWSTSLKLVSTHGVCHVG